MVTDPAAVPLTIAVMVNGEVSTVVAGTEKLGLSAPESAAVTVYLAAG